MTILEKHKQGVLSKELFLQSEVTQGFTNWLRPYLSGEQSLKSINKKYSFDNLKTAAEKYEWKPDKSYEDTFNKFVDYKNSLHNATGKEQAKEICKEILIWGGIKNHDRLSAIGDVLFFLNHMKQKLNSDEICIYDLNPNYISSGFSKLYAAYIDGFTMYDGRTGAALCSLIGDYLQENKSKEIPAELLFGWAWGMGNPDTRKNRNPNRKEFKFGAFPEINERRRELHFISNIKANWLLESIASNKNLFDKKSKAKRVFALQSALFMLGEVVPED